LASSGIRKAVSLRVPCFKGLRAADFAGTGAPQYRAFLSSYFVLDITNPEKDPVLLWTFRDMDLGFTTSMPAVVRVNPALDAKSNLWVMFGTGRFCSTLDGNNRLEPGSDFWRAGRLQPAALSRTWKSPLEEAAD